VKGRRREEMHRKLGKSKGRNNKRTRAKTNEIDRYIDR